MGCNQSTPASDEEKQAICKAMAKDMMELCAIQALSKSDEVVIKAPDDLETIKTTSAKLKEKAGVIKRMAEENGEEEEPEEGNGGGGGGGMFGLLSSVAGAAGDLLQAGAEKILEKGMKGVAKTMVTLAEGLDKAIAQVEEPMTSIGQQIVENQKDDLAKTLSEYIKAAPVNNAVVLCMTPPAKDAISKAVIVDCLSDLSDKLKPRVDAAIDQHTVINAWDNCINMYNDVMKKIDDVKQAASDKLGVDLSDWQVDKVDLDLKKYICDSATKEFGRLMGVAEVKFRADTAGDGAQGKGAYPDIFLKVFRENKVEGRDDLLHKDYKEVCG